MKWTNILNAFGASNIDEKNLDSKYCRRGFFTELKGRSHKAALIALPLAISAVPKVARAQGSNNDVLNFALSLEYLENEFYQMGLAASGLIPVSDRPIFEQISKHETAHVNFLKGALGSNAIAQPTFDFTAGGAYPTVFSDYAVFLTLAQAFEDAGVRAYKGQAGNLMADDSTLTQALQIHSVEARHAAEVRWLRAEVTGSEIKPWIELKNGNGAPQPVYDGEENLNHGGIDLNGISTLNNFSAEAKTRAFDEPLTREQVQTIVNPFFIS